jgi:uncharacterized cupredoxin-like copper-binding protein
VTAATRELRRLPPAPSTSTWWTRPSNGGGHGSGDDDQNALTLDPGKQGELIYTFDGTGPLEIGCHQPGHYAAGMKIAVTVT